MRAHVSMKVEKDIIMAGRVSPQHKAVLRKAGYWSAFQHRRDELKLRGLSPKDARSQALSEYLPKSEEYLESRPPPLPNFWTCLVNDLSGSPETVKWLLVCLEGRYSQPPSPGAKFLYKRCRTDAGFLREFLEKALAKLEEDHPDLADRIKKANRDALAGVHDNPPIFSPSRLPVTNAGVSNSSAATGLPVKDSLLPSPRICNHDDSEWA